MEKFIEKVLEALNDLFDGKVVVREVTKGNDVKLHGIVFIKKGNEIGRANPTVYAEAYYDDYKRGDNIYHIADRMIEAVENDGGALAEEDFTLLADWNYAKERVVPIALGKERNKDYLQTLAYTDTKTDIAEAYTVVIKENDEGEFVNVKVTKDMMTLYGIDIKELRKVARENAFKKYMFENMAKILYRSMGFEPEEAELMQTPMWVLSTQNRTWGAGTMFNTKILKDVVKKTGKETFYILPSSIHEVLIITDDTVNAEDLKKVVETVNETEVSAPEVLSDSVYFYDGKSVKVVA